VIEVPLRGSVRLGVLPARNGDCQMKIDGSSALGAL